MKDEVLGVPIVVDPALHLVGIDWGLVGDHNAVFVMRDGKIVEIDFPIAARRSIRHEGSQPKE